MHLNQRHNERGFTLIELLVSLGIVGTLAFLAIFVQAEIRAKAIDTARLQLLTRAEQALQVGMGDYEGASEQFIDTVLTTGKQAGITSIGGRNLLPGFVNPENTFLFARWENVCNNADPGNCIHYVLVVQDCREMRRSAKVTWQDGNQVLLENISAPACA